MCSSSGSYSILKTLRLKNPKLVLLESCSNVGHLKIVHAHMLRSHLFFDLFAASRLVAFCVHSPSLLPYAIKVVSQIQGPNLFIYNALIRGCSTTQNPEHSFHYYIKALRFGLLPDNITHPFLVKACAQLESSPMGMQVHGHIIKHGFEHDCYVQNSLVHMYATVGDINAARNIFRRMLRFDIVSWTCMITGYHRCGDVESARELFDRMPERNLVTWSTMISGYARNNRFDKAVELFEALQAEGVLANETVMVGVISSCAHLGALAKGEKAHEYVVRNGLSLNMILGTAVVDMYARCGDVEKAVKVFEQLHEKDVLCWTALIGGLAMHGYAEKALWYFSEMLKTRMAPRDITFTAVLAACSHGGMVEREEKEGALHRHSEKLAIAYGIMKIRAPTPIRIVKNLRVCEDCHTATKLISRVFEVELIVRDRNRFHHFKEGTCSCLDYW
ncbi:hypothetical protein Fmac_006536 [Flemingia macrophylla]|uniref:DYW domain-containing protein n=1 Tax=Flemingia macrophylla TaxID=520843 RepID=A0ABD1NAW5_9FABA